MNKKPWQDNKGHFTFEENDGGECPHNSGTKEYRQNTPYEEIIGNGLTNIRSNSIIQLPKSEYAIISKQVFEMQVRANRTKKQLPKNMFISTANYCYLVSISGGAFSVLLQLDIEKDWERLKEIRERYELFDE